MEYDGKFHATLSVLLVPQIVDLIVKNEKMGDVEATNAFYQSKTYALLENEESKIWHYSPLTLYNIWKND